METNDIPGRCKICGNYFTTSAEFASSRCMEPGHWLAAGVLSPTDYYPIAKIAARASAKSGELAAKQNPS